MNKSKREITKFMADIEKFIRDLAIENSRREFEVKADRALKDLYRREVR